MINFNEKKNTISRIENPSKIYYAQVHLLYINYIINYKLT